MRGGLEEENEGVIFAGYGAEERHHQRKGANALAWYIFLHFHHYWKGFL